MAESEVKTDKITVKGVLRGIWQFCSYLFVPQWGKRPKDYGQDGYLEEQLAKQGENRKSCGIYRIIRTV